MQVLARSLELCLLREICDIDDQCVSFSMANCISVPLVDVLWQMRPFGNRNDLTEILPLADVIVNPDRTRRLHNSRYTSERPGLEQNRHRISETTLWTASILWSVR